MASGTWDLRPRPAVYRVYDESGTLLYVGMSENVHRRLTDHLAQGAMWAERAHRVEWDEYPTRETALVAEREMIRDLGPLYNVVGGQHPAQQPADGRRPAWNQPGGSGQPSRWTRYRTRKRGAPPREQKPHGTTAAARRHQRAKEPLRDLCAPVWAEHQAAMYRQRRERRSNQRPSGDGT